MGKFNASILERGGSLTENYYKSIYWEVEEAVPLRIQDQTSLLDKKMEAIVWVHHDMIAISKLLGADLSGH